MQAVPKQATSNGGGHYFEFSDGKSNKFWEITLAGDTHTVRFGKIGSAGQTSQKRFKTAAAAYEDYVNLVREKLGKVYARKRGEPQHPPESKRDAKLEAAIEADPDNADGYLVYADWLQSHGDPRGELIARRRRPPRSCSRRTRSTSGASSPSSRRSTSKTRSAGCSITRRAGSCASSPSASSRSSTDYSGIAKVLGKRTLPTLKSLFLGDFDPDETELNWSDLGNLEPMYKAIPNLETLTLRSGRMKLGKIDLPNLRELRIITGGFDTKSLASICNAKWPKLETLNIQLGNETRFTLKHLQPIFRRDLQGARGVEDRGAARIARSLQGDDGRRGCRRTRRGECRRSSSSSTWARTG